MRDAEARSAITIVVVEDERLVASHLHTTLEKAGYTVLGTAGTDVEALSLCASELPHIVLMDIGLKGSAMDGIEVAEKLLDDHDIRVIYLTGSVDVAAMDRAKRTRPHAYLLKPINTAQLLGAIEVAAFQLTKP